MSFLSNLLTSQSHPLRLPAESRGDVERFVRQHQKGTVSLELVPFRRQLDFWAFSIGAAVARGIAPRAGASSKWGRRFADTHPRTVQMPEALCEMLAVVAFDIYGQDDEKAADPAAIIELGNRLAGSGCPVLLRELTNPDLRTTTLDKALAFARILRSEVRDVLSADNPDREAAPEEANPHSGGDGTQGASIRDPG